MTVTSVRRSSTLAPDATEFSARHIGPTSETAATMLETLGYDSLAELVDAAVPEAIRQPEPLNLPEALSEAETLQALRGYAEKNQPAPR